MSKYAGRNITLATGTPLAVTGAEATDLFTSATHGLAAGDAVVFTSATGGTGLTTYKKYYVISTGLTTTAFKVSTTAGGTALDITTALTAGSFYKATTIGQVTSVPPVGSTRDLIDASAYGDSYKDYVVGQQDGTELEISVAYDPTNTGHALLLSQYAAGTAIRMEMSHSEASTFAVTWPAMLTKVERGGEIGGLLVMNVSAKVLSPGVADLT